MSRSHHNCSCVMTFETRPEVIRLGYTVKQYSLIKIRLFLASQTTKYYQIYVTKYFFLTILKNFIPRKKLLLISISGKK